jgi:hypothetical protein
MAGRRKSKTSVPSKTAGIPVDDVRQELKHLLLVLEKYSSKIWLVEGAANRGSLLWHLRGVAIDSDQTAMSIRAALHKLGKDG